MNNTCIEERGLAGYHVVINGVECVNCQSTNFSWHLDETSKLDLTTENNLKFTTKIELRVGSGGIVFNGVDVGSIICLYNMNVPVVLAIPKLLDSESKNYKLLSQILVSPFSKPKIKVESQTSGHFVLSASTLLLSIITFA